jgi:hypothetical protein
MSDVQFLFPFLPTNTCWLLCSHGGEHSFLYLLDILVWSHTVMQLLWRLVMCSEEEEDEPTSKEGSAPAEGEPVRPAQVQTVVHVFAGSDLARLAACCNALRGLTVQPVCVMHSSLHVRVPQLTPS